ncbi:DUF4864 domain-containing protein [Mesobaculum littorinae]|uniref:DUF4864 domain-containing protein n=2 Tax=Mesobaculum littorinae TaxID=2486419 RepID=A0A438AHN7_9RHOB|nr:DUF4864 domain-containing protein [Mesobaculum littorinae]
MGCGLALSASFWAPAGAQDAQASGEAAKQGADVGAEAGREAAIAAVIGDQFAAFRADDFVTAFDFAAPGIQAMFGSPDRFGAMVRNGYPMVHRPAEVEFLGLSEVAGGLHQKVMVRDSSGALHLLDYEMIATPEGWRIGAVRLLTADAVGA